MSRFPVYNEVFQVGERYKLPTGEVLTVVGIIPEFEEARRPRILVFRDKNGQRWSYGYWGAQRINMVKIGEEATET